MTRRQTAAVIVIGNEILSGKTAEANVQYIAGGLGELGIVLVEARVIRDDVQAIVDTVRELSERHTYVFTTGGIGPTHDDITADSVARAFEVELELNDEAVRLLKGRYGDISDARLRMARIPAGASLIKNAVSVAPGFRIGNVFVLAGVPSIARAMFDALSEDLVAGPKIHSANLDVFMRESEVAEPLAAIAEAHPEVEIGSYPFIRDGQYGANLVVRGTDESRVASVLAEIEAAAMEVVKSRD